MAGSWDQFPVVGGEPQQGGGVILSDPYQERGDRRDETRTGLAVEGNARDASRFNNEVDKDARQGMGDLRKEFTALPEVKRYGTVVQQVDTILHTRPDAAGDQDLIYAIAQLRDPLGSVREGDSATIEGGQAAVDRMVQQLKKQLGQGGTFSNEYRQQLRREAIARLNTANRAYSQARTQYEGIARAANFDPTLVVGPHAGDAFVERFKAYDEANGLGGSNDGFGVAAPPAPEDNQGPTSLPRAAGAHDQGGAPADGVTPKGEGYRVEPALYHLGNTVADMIAKGADVGQIRQYLDEQYKPFGVETSPPMMAAINEVIQAHKAAPGKPIKSLRPGWDAFHMVPENSGPTLIGQIADSKLGAAALGVGDIYTVGMGDEIAGAIAGDNYNAALDYAKEERPYSYAAGQLVGALTLPTGAPEVGLKAGTAALRGGEGMAAARLAATRAAAGRTATEAGVYGTAHGFGSGEGGLEDRLAGAVVEGGLGYLVPKGVGAVLSRSKAAQSVGPAAISDEVAGADNAAEYMAAAGRQGVTPFVGDISTPAAAAAGKFAQTQAGVGPVTKAAKATYNTTVAARDRIARAIGSPMEGEALGYRLSEGAKKAIAREHGNAQAFYKTAERQSEGLRIRPTEAYQTISDEIDKIADTGLGDKALNIFRRVQDRMTQGPMSVETLRNIRTQIREDLATEGIRGGKADAAARRVMEAITKDVDGALRSNGMEGAADAFQQGDQLWAAYTELTDNVIAPIIGKEGDFSGEAVVKRLQADLRGNNARAAHFLRALPAEEQQLARSSIIQSLGRTRDGSFGFGEFVKHWADIGDSAKEAYFGADLRAALNDLDAVARGAKQSNRWANHSNSGGAINAPLETVAAFGTVGLSALLTNVSARLLTSKAAVKWLTAAAKKPNEAALASHVKRLTGLAEAEPAIANEVLSLQQRLTESLSRSPVSVYADEKGDGGKKPPKQGEGGNAP